MTFDIRVFPRQISHYWREATQGKVIDDSIILKIPS